MRTDGHAACSAPVLGLGRPGRHVPIVPAATVAADADVRRGPLAGVRPGRAGRPTKSGGRAGDYIWHSGTGWHLRVTHRDSSSRSCSAGKIVSNAPLSVDRLPAGGR